jgi:hypothetical protein
MKISDYCKGSRDFKHITEYNELLIFPNERFEVFTAVTIKNAVYWDIKTLFVLHRRHITSLLQNPAD